MEKLASAERAAQHFCGFAEAAAETEGILQYKHAVKEMQEMGLVVIKSDYIEYGQLPHLVNGRQPLKIF